MLTCYGTDFGNSIREYALSTGKRNFLMVGEIHDDEKTILQFIVRNTTGSTSRVSW